MSEENCVESRLRKTLLNCSVEISPNPANNFKLVKEHLPEGTKVFIVSPEGCNFADIVATATELRSSGFEPVPHFAARSIKDSTVLEENLRKLRGEAGISEVLVIGGGGSKPIGIFDNSLQLLETGLFRKHDINRVAVAGHPEGHPSVRDEVLFDALRRKRAFVENCGAEFFVISQFCFDVNSIIKWENTSRKLMGSMRVHVGIPGLASLKSLIKYARICGIGSSMKFISRNLENVLKLARTWSPDKLLYELSEYKENNPEFGMERFHFYSFGELSLTARWINAVCEGKKVFELDGQVFNIYS